MAILGVLPIVVGAALVVAAVAYTLQVRKYRELGRKLPH
jgi:hypothetical protein